MQRRWCYVPLSTHKGGNLSSLVAAELPSILNMQVPWDEQQEQKTQESRAKQSLVWYRWQSWKSDPMSLEEHRRFYVDPGHRKKKLDIDVTLETQRSCNIRIVSYLLRKTAFRKQNHSKKKILLHWTKQKEVGDLKNTLTTDMKMQSLGLPSWIRSYLGPLFLHAAFRNGKVCTVNLGVYGVLFCFWTWLYDRIIFRRFFDLWTFLRLL